MAAITETILLGTIAVRVDRKLRWDGETPLRGRPRGRALMTREYREGWKL